MYKELSTVEENMSKSPKETITPYKVAVILFIKSYCASDSSRKSIPERRDFCIVALKLIQTPDMELNSLMTMILSPDYTIQNFARELERDCNVLCDRGIEGLLNLFDDLTKLMKPSIEHSLNAGRLCRNSVLGIYVRRTIAFFEELSFSEVAHLYDAFVKDVRDMLNNLVFSQNPTIGETPDKKNKNKNIWDGRRAELLVAQQAKMLKTDEHKAMPPAQLQALVRELLQSNSYNPEAHYLSYLNCLRVNEYCGALDSLYHCFDRLAPLESRNGSEDRSRTFRYAALNLAVLHAQFNHKKVALAALKEAIMMAQEAGDNVCLQLAHAWMYYLSSKTKGYLIERSIGKASMLGITHTMSLGLIASAHHSALDGKSPPYVFETLLKSDVLNCQHSMTDLMSLSFAEKAALWAYYGKSVLSTVCAQLLLLHNSGTKKQSLFNGESTCQAVINIANTLVDVGEYGLVNVVLSHAKERFPNEPSNKIWILSERLFQFTKMMRHEKWSDAEAVAMHISSLDTVESKFRLAEVSLAKGDYPTGLKYLNKIEKESLTAQNRIRSMILSSQFMSSSEVPGHGIAGTNSLVLLNSALEMATRHYLSYHEALVKMHLANIQLVMGMPSQASSLIDEAIIQILAHGDLFERGRALVLYAKCLIALAPSVTDKRKGILQDAIKSLLKAKGHFSKIEAFGRVRNALYLLGMVYNEIGLKAERNKSAFEFRKINEQYPSKSDTITIMMY